MHVPELIRDLALILVVSGAVAITFRWLKQPIVLGYLLAGVLVGPHVTIIPTVSDTKNLTILAELGVIFLLFVLGLEFSFRKLFQVGKTALIAATFEVVVMLLLGFGTGWFLGWESMDSLFLGGILAISSTTIIVKAFDEQGVKTQSFAALVFGILIIEDLFAILLLAVLSTVAATRSLEGLPLIKQSGILLGLLGIAIPIGLWITPRFFRVIRSQLNDETRVIVSLALCLALVLASTYAGFSPALGAFLMGAFMGETSEGERVERFLKPIRDLFGAIFFTSVGMLVDINTIISSFPVIILISIVTILGKILSTSGGALLAGQDRKSSFQAGFSLAQIGEFSFIIATLGLTLNVIRPEIYPLAVSVSLITTFLTPYLIRFAVSSRLFAKTKGEAKNRGSKLHIWDGHLVEFEIHPHFLNLGLSLQQLKLREKFGVSIVALTRGERTLVAPTRNDLLMPFDRIVVLGTDAQLASLEKFLKSERHDLEDADNDVRFVLEKIPLKADHYLIGKNLRESGIREKIQGMILGIERKREKILNPDSTIVFKSGDVVWIYGRSDLLRAWHAEHGEAPFLV